MVITGESQVAESRNLAWQILLSFPHSHPEMSFNWLFNTFWRVLGGFKTPVREPRNASFGAFRGFFYGKINRLKH